MKKILLLAIIGIASISQTAFARIHSTNADYDGDGRVDQATWNSTNGMWRITNARTKRITTIQHGMRGDIPVPADYDGDGAAEVTVWRPSNGNWYISTENRSWSVRGNSYWVRQHGSRGDIPVPANYDGDKAIEIAVYRPSTGVCYISTANKSWKNKGSDYRITQDYRCGR